MGKTVSVKAMTGVVTVPEGAMNGAVKAAMKGAMATAESPSGGVDLRQGETEQDCRCRGDEFS
jgi:hypothetical protein